MKTILKFSFLLLLCLQSQAFAKVVVEKIDRFKKIAVVKVVERIQHEEEIELKRELDKLSKDGYKLKLNAVVLHTAGGNSSSAREMGELIRQRKLNTYVGPDDFCASACIYVLAGGIVRMAFGTVNVHRTTYTEIRPIEKLEKWLKITDEQTRTFIERMGLSPLLSDAIITTPNWASRTLDELDKKRWGVHGTERMYDELWFRNTATNTGRSLDDVNDLFSKHISECSAKAKRFEITVWDCIRQEIK